MRRRAIKIKNVFERQQGTQTKNQNQHLEMNNFSQLEQGSFWATFTTTKMNFFWASTFPHTLQG
jgi:hypothetical protein